MAYISIGTTTTGSAMNSSSLTFPVDSGTPDSNTMLIVSFGTSLGGTVTGMTYAGDALTEAESNGNKTYVYYIMNPTSGSNNLVISMSGSVQTLTAEATIIENVDSNNPIGATANNDNSGTSITSSITTLRDNSYVIDAVTTTAGIYGFSTTESGQVETAESITNGRGGAQSYKPVTTAGSTDLGWNAGISGTVYHTLVEINAEIISGNVTLGGSPQSGVNVNLINETDDTLERKTTTDTNGDYRFAYQDSKTYHITFAYDSGTTKYNAESKPFLST